MRARTIHPKDAFLYRHQGNVSLQQLRALQKTTTNQNTGVVETSPEDTFIMHLIPKTESLLWIVEEVDTKIVRDRKFAVRLCLLEMSEPTLIQSHKHESLSMN